MEKNKYEEALHYFESYIGVTDNPVTNQLVEEYVDVLNELIYKEVPLTPVNRELENLVEDGWITIATGHCPICDYEDLNQTHDYCCSCGQKLDWSDND